MSLNAVQFSRLISQITALRGSSLNESDIEPIAETVSNFSGNATVDSLNRLLLAMRDGRKINAIKEYRAMTGMPLKESKDAIEACWSYVEHHAIAAAE